MNAQASFIDGLTPVEQYTFLQSLDPRTFHLVISPTEHCNFRCVYCYEKFDKGRMSPAVVKGLKRFLARKIPHLRELRTSWFGGEPLIAAELCYDIAHYACSLCGTHNVHFTGNFTTNGSLLTVDQVARFISVNQNGYQITLDGDQVFHDSVRLRADKKGTFANIWENLIALHNTDLPFIILLRLHVRQSNKDSLCRLIARAKRELAGDARFQFGFHKVEDLGGPNQGKFEITSADAYECCVQRLTEQLQPEFTIQDFYEDDLLHICYASKPNSLFLRPNGIIGKCTVALDDELNKVGELREDGQIYMSGPKLAAWTSGFRELRTNVLSCPLSAIHHDAGQARCEDIA